MFRTYPKHRRIASVGAVFFVIAVSGGVWAEDIRTPAVTAPAKTDAATVIDAIASSLLDTQLTLVSSSPQLFLQRRSAHDYAPASKFGQISWQPWLSWNSQSAIPGFQVEYRGPRNYPAGIRSVFVSSKAQWPVIPLAPVRSLLDNGRLHEIGSATPDKAFFADIATSVAPYVQVGGTEQTATIHITKETQDEVRVLAEISTLIDGFVRDGGDPRLALNKTAIETRVEEIKAQRRSKEITAERKAWAEDMAKVKATATPAAVLPGQKENTYFDVRITNGSPRAFKTISVVVSRDGKEVRTIKFKNLRPSGSDTKRVRAQGTGPIQCSIIGQADNKK